MTANKTFLSGVNCEIFDWWFAWHPIDRLRYACRDHDDHYDVYLEDPIKARNITKSMRERHWGSVHHIREDIGLGNGPIALLNHNVKEFTNQTAILAPLYAEEKDNW